MYQVQRVDLVQCIQDLECDPLQLADRELQRIFSPRVQLTVHFLQLVQIVFQ